MLKAKTFSNWGYASLMYHNSTIAYGEWNIDYLLPNVTSMIHTAFVIMWTDKNTPEFSIDGHFEDTYLSKVEGYAVFLTSTEMGFPTIKLIKYTSLYSPLIETLGETSDLPNNAYPSNLQIRVTRGLDGNFTVYGNSQQLFSAIDNDYTTSEYIGIVSWRLGFQLDNITIEEMPGSTTTTTTPTTSNGNTTSSTSANTNFEIPMFALPVFLVYIGLRRRRKIT